MEGGDSRPRAAQRRPPNYPARREPPALAVGWLTILGPENAAGLLAYSAESPVAIIVLSGWFYATLSRRALAGRNRTALPAGTSTISPVRRLRPVLAARGTTLKIPRPSLSTYALVLSVL